MNENIVLFKTAEPYAARKTYSLSLQNIFANNKMRIV